MARVEKPSGRRVAPGVRRRVDAVVAHRGGCYTGSSRGRGSASAAPGRRVTRSLPARFEAYIAPSALIDQLVGRAAVVRVGDDADRERRPRADARQVDRHRADPEPDLLGQDVRAGRIGLGQEDDELVAAVAGRRVDLADARRDDLADAAQDLVAGEVAEPVVDGLELVEVHHQQAEAAARAGAPGDLALDRREEEGPVEQPRQRVDRRQADRRVARPPLLAGDDHARRRRAGRARSG